MKLLKTIGLMTAYFIIVRGSDVRAQITTLSGVQSNAAVTAQMVRSNANATAKYQLLHPDESETTNSLTPHQLELLDIATDRTTWSNYLSQPHSTQELEEMTNTISYMLTNAAAQSSYFFHRHGDITQLGYRSNLINALRHAPPPQPWPEPSNRREIFERSAEVLRSAIDTNQIEMACSKFDQPEAAAVLRNVAKNAITNLAMFANLLISSDLNSYLGAGYRAEISNPTNVFYFGFWPSTLVKNVEKRTPDGLHVLVNVRFYENGKLLAFNVNSFDNKGGYGTQMQLVLKEDGTLRSYFMKPQGPKQ